ncbi:hypothetical protein Pfo_021534, partial [Paulownia fortunei]
MESERKKGYAWAISAGLNAALAAISAKFFSSQLKYALVIFFNVIMWGCYVNSMKSLSSLQATVTNFATNFLSSGLSGFFLFEEALPVKWFAGAVLIVIGVIVLSKSSVEKKTHTKCGLKADDTTWNMLNAKVAMSKKLGWVLTPLHHLSLLFLPKKLLFFSKT